MSITEIKDKIKSSLKIPKKADYIVCAVIIGVGITSFFLGRLSSTPSDLEPVIISNAIPFPTTSSTFIDPSGPTPRAASGSFVASVNGTKYYPIGCSGAGRINEENKIYFDSAEAARAAGYEISVLCE